MAQTTLQRAGVGTEDYIAIGRQYTPGGSGSKGVAASRTAFLPWKSNTLNPKKPPILDKVSRGAATSAGVRVPGIETDDGQLTWLMNTRLGIDILWAALGGEGAISAINATAVGPVVTANGVSTIPVTGGFVAGEPVLINAATATEEPTVVQSYSAGSLVVPALSMFNGANISANNVPVTMPACEKYALSLMGGTDLNDYPLLTIEKAIAKLWGQLFIDVLIEALTLNFNKGLHEITASPYGTGEMADLTSGQLTSYAPPTADEKKALAPLSALVGAISLMGDPLGTGTSTQQAAVGVQSATINYTNNPVKDTVLTNPVMQAFGRDANVTVDLTVLETDRRSATFMDQVKSGALSAMMFAFARNYGTAAVPVNKMMTAYMPSMGADESILSSAPGGLRTWANKMSFSPTPGGASDPMILYVTS